MCRLPRRSREAPPYSSKRLFVSTRALGEDGLAALQLVPPKAVVLFELPSAIGCYDDGSERRRGAARPLSSSSVALDECSTFGEPSRLGGAAEPERLYQLPYGARLRRLPFDARRRRPRRPSGRHEPLAGSASAWISESLRASASEERPPVPGLSRSRRSKTERVSLSETNSKWPCRNRSSTETP